MEKSTQKKSNLKKREVTEVTMVEKELLLNSMTQQELLKTTKELNKTIKELTKTIQIVENSEYFAIHKNKWRIAIYNVTLGILFAFGTVFGLVLLSWLTFNFFKDSVILKQIVENQLRIRQIDMSQIPDFSKNITKPVEKSTSKSINTASGVDKR